MAFFAKRHGLRIREGPPIELKDPEASWLDYDENRLFPPSFILETGTGKERLYDCSKWDGSMSFERPSNCISLTSRRVESLFLILRQRASWSKSRPHNRALHRRAPIVASGELFRWSARSAGATAFRTGDESP